MVELEVVEQSLHVGRSLLGELLLRMPAKGEGIAAMVKRALGVVQVVGACLGAKVGELRVGFPSPTEVDVCSWGQCWRRARR